MKERDPNDCRSFQATTLENTTGGGRHHQIAPSGAGTFGGSTTGPTTGLGRHTNDLGYSGDPGMNAGQGMTGTNTVSVMVFVIFLLFANSFLSL